MMRRSIPGLLAGLLLSTLGTAATYTVTTTADTGAGSLRDAITQANSTAAVADVIAFNIAGAGVHTIAPASPLPDLTSPVTINGYTQSGSSPNTAALDQPINATLTIELDCTNVGFNPCLRIGANDTTIRGLVVNRSSYYAITTDFFKLIENAVIEGCFLGTNTAGTAGLSPFAGGPYFGQHKNARIGGTTPGARNLIASKSNNGWLVSLTYAPDAGSVIQGNFIGTDRTGATRVNIDEPEFCIYLNGGPANNNGSGYTVGGLAAGAGNVIACRDFGIRITGATDVTIQGNHIGVDRTGTKAIGRGQSSGIMIENGGTALIGGTGAGAGNVIGGVGTGIYVPTDPVSPVVIQGNFIGTDATGTLDLGNEQEGVYTSGATVVGGTGSGEGNQILFNHGNGVRTISGSGMTVRGNRIQYNWKLGIELGSQGPAANDAGDADTGANGLQNNPRITSAAPEGAGTRVIGTLNSTPSSSFTVDFYANPACRFRPRLQLQADQYLGAANVNTDASGNASFNVLLSTPITAGQPVTATATDADGSTSELSPEIVFATTPDVGSSGTTPQLTIAGMLFSGTPTVTVGGVAATGVNVTSPTELKAFAPSRPAGSVNDIIVTLAGGAAGRLRNGYVSRFEEVGAFDLYDAAIHKLAANGITLGCGVGKYCPDNTITRAEMAIFLIRAKYGLCFTPPAATGTLFSDVAASSFGARHIELLANLGVTSGCGGGKFCPNSTVTRDQMAVFLLRTLIGSHFLPQPATGQFTDVPASNVFAKWIEELNRRGITSGCGGGKFCPEQPNTRGEMAVFINRTFGLP
jgi:hypothetical protein